MGGRIGSVGDRGHESDVRNNVCEAQVLSDPVPQLPGNSNWYRHQEDSQDWYLTHDQHWNRPQEGGGRADWCGYCLLPDGGLQGWLKRLRAEVRSLKEGIKKKGEIPIGVRERVMPLVVRSTRTSSFEMVSGDIRLLGRRCFALSQNAA